MEVENLKSLKDRIRPKTAFGDDNVAGVEAQITVLEELMDEADVWENSDNEDEGGDGDWDSSVVDHALEAVRWLEGESEDGAPSVGWKELIMK